MLPPGRQSPRRRRVNRAAHLQGGVSHATLSPTDALAAALAYATAGYSVQWCPPRQKKCVDKGWSTRPTLSTDALTQTWRPRKNVGVRCGHWSCPQPGMGLVVLDIDITPQAEHSEPFEYLGRFYDGPVADVLSGSGLGRHWWFACPLEALPAKANTLLTKSPELVIYEGKTVPAWKIEVLSTGMQIMAPPSVHPSGRRYQWLTPWDPLPLLPPDILEALPTARAAAPLRAPTSAADAR